MTDPFSKHGLTIRFGGHVAVDAVSCAFHPGELTVIVGPNGAGKTTYFNLISGQLHGVRGHGPADGRGRRRATLVALRGRKGIGRAFQLTNLFPGAQRARKRPARRPGEAGVGWASTC
jgi:branched-chain amino acid transport system ATP-binding protein